MLARAGSTVRVLLVLVGVLAASGQPQIAAAQTPEPAAPASAESVRAALDGFCVRCHNDRLRTAGLALDAHDLAEVGADAETWERVIVKLRSRTMPPAGSPRPAEATYRSVASWLETAIDNRRPRPPGPGPRRDVHRLNRAEYHAAVRDLLAVDVDVAELLPADDTYEHGFDNNGDVLSISPDLVGRYLSAARRISRLAVGIPPIGPAVATYRVHPGLVQDDRQDDLLSFGSRGGIAIPHYFPVDGEYTIRVRLHRNFSDYIIGYAAPQELDVRVDGALVERFDVGDADSVGQMAPAELLRQHRRGPRVGVLHEHRGRPPGGPFPGEGGSADGGRVLRAAAVGGRGGAAAAQPGLRPLRRRTVRRGRGGGAGGDWRPVLGRGSRRHAEPPRDLRLRAGGGRRGRRRRGLRRPDSRPAGPPGVSAARGRRRRRGAARLLPRRAPRGRLRRRHPVRAGADARRPRVPVPHRGRSRGRRAGDALPARRPRAGVEAVVLPVEQHPRRRAARGRGRRAARRPGGARAADAAAARRRPRGGPSSTTSRASGCDCATSSRRSASRPTTPSSTRTCARRSGARPSCSSRAASARTAASSSCSARTTRSSTSGWPATTASPGCTATASGGSPSTPTIRAAASSVTAAS